MKQIDTTRELTPEHRERARVLLCDRIRSRLWLMREALNIISEERCGEGIEVCATSLEGASFIIDDILKEVEEAAELLHS
jgi:hypothetical protein